MNSSFSSFSSQYSRLSILQILQQAGNYQINQQILQSALDEVGICLSAEKIRSECSWLEAQKLVKIDNITKDLYVINLTEVGLDVASARHTISGVARPRPKL